MGEAREKREGRGARERARGREASTPTRPTGRVVISHGALAAESRLVEMLAEVARASARDPRSLREPVLVIAPSRSVRAHLCARVVEQCGRAVAGIRFETLDAFAASILARAGEQRAFDRALFPALVRELAQREAVLRESLGALKHGYAAAIAVVSDLLDAGFEPAHADAVLELIDQSSRGPLAARASALARVASLAAAQLDASSVGHASCTLRRAREQLDADPAGALRARAVHVFGFADATGLQTDLIETLLRRCGAWVHLDRPPDPSDVSRADPGVAFSDRFSARLCGAFGVEVVEHAERTRAPAVSVLRAPDLDAEARGIANRVRERLDAGVRPERIAVVARDLERYRCALRVQLSRLGIPFSGADDRPGIAPADRRRIRGLRELLHAGPRATLDLWLDLVDELPASVRYEPLCAARRSELRLAFHARGLGRLADASRFERCARPRREPASARAASAGAAGAASAATATAELLSRWPERAALAAHLEALRALVDAQLRWPSDGVARVEL
ncbi:MAG TPA: hypothetical protein VEC18_10030, partial [Myxococcota bacterium]|nr:hypothetical protein [Myxococcota bacterium]